MLKSLQERGWATFSYDGNDLASHLIELAATLGTPAVGRKRKVVVERLTPLGQQDAKPSSLSRKFGLGALPLHTDTAHWVEPSRYVILGCFSTGLCGRKTILADSTACSFSDGQWRQLMMATYRVVNGRHSFFASIFGREQLFCRFDQACMVPVDNFSADVMKRMAESISSAAIAEIDWLVGKVLVIDNWRMLHGREEALRSDDQREIIRVLSK